MIRKLINYTLKKKKAYDIIWDGLTKKLVINTFEKSEEKMDILEIKRELEEINKNLVENRGHLWPW